MLILIIGILYLIIWGFDFKYENDVGTWLWFVCGLVLVIIGIFFMKNKKIKDWKLPWKN